MKRKVGEITFTEFDMWIGLGLLYRPTNLHPWDTDVQIQMTAQAVINQGRNTHFMGEGRKFKKQNAHKEVECPWHVPGNKHP